MSSSVFFAGPLPSELFHQVLRHLDDPRDLVRASGVSKAWKRAATEERLWVGIYRRFYRRNASLADSERSLLEDAWLRALLVASTLPLPPFVRQLQDEKAARDAIGTNGGQQQQHARALFEDRLRLDERLLADLETYAMTARGRLSYMVDMVTDYGDLAKDFLAAVVANQLKLFETAQVTRNTDHFLSAMDIHMAATSGSALPWQPAIGVYHAALDFLNHLQRGAGARIIQDLVALEFRATQRGLAIEACHGAEQALSAVDLLVNTAVDKCELESHLDMLAIAIWEAF